MKSNFFRLNKIRGKMKKINTNNELKKIFIMV